MPRSDADPGRPKSPPGLLRSLHQAVRFAFPQRHAIAAIMGTTLGVVAINALEPLVIKSIFDELTGSRQLQQLGLSLLILALLAMAHELMSGWANWLTWRTRIGVQYALLEATVGKLHSMPLRMQRSEGTGAIMTRLDRSIQGFIGAVSLLLFNILPSVIFLVIAAWIMLGLDWRLALVAFLFAPLPAWIFSRAGPEQTLREKTLLDRWANIYSRFNEVLSGILVVRSFAREEAEKARFLREVAQANQVVMRGVAIDTGYTAASNLVVAVARLWVIGVGAYFVLQGEITIGTVVAFFGYVGGLFGPVQGLSGVYTSLRKAAISLEEIFRILNVEEHLADSPEAVDLADLKGDVAFETVSFHYDGDCRPLLDGVTLEVRRGQTMAIVGPSGSGKTTLMALLMRFYDPCAGRITIDGRDLRTVKQTSLRRNVGVVLQDPLLFNDTVSANIAYGRPDASREDIEAAARAAHAHEFICRLPQGYETIVGERGGLLSAGERQRITIARALLKDPPILVFDEATSALDAESEEAVQTAVETLLKGRTTFVIAHRLSTVINADCITVLRNGRVVESGRHADLMRRDGHYASLVRRQSRGLIPNDADGSARNGARTSGEPPPPPPYLAV